MYISSGLYALCVSSICLLSGLYLYIPCLLSPLVCILSGVCLYIHMYACYLLCVPLYVSPGVISSCFLYVCTSTTRPQDPGKRPIGRKGKGKSLAASQARSSCGFPPLLSYKFRWNLLLFEVCVRSQTLNRAKTSK